MKRMNKLLLSLLAFLIIHQSYAQTITIEPGTYYTNQKRVGRITIKADAYGKVHIKRKVRAEIGKIIGGIAGGIVLGSLAPDIELNPLAKDYVLRAIEGKPNHYIEYWESSNRRMCVTLLRVYDGYMLFTTLVSGNCTRDDFYAYRIHSNYIIASSKEKVATLVASQKPETILGQMYPASLNEHYQKNINKIVFINKPTVSEFEFEDNSIQTYTLGDPLFVRFCPAEEPIRTMFKEFPGHEQGEKRRYIGLRYVMYLDGKLIGTQVFIGNGRGTIISATNHEYDIMWEECIFSPDRSCTSTFGQLYSEKILAENSNLLTEGEHTLLVRLEGYKGSEQISTPPLAEGSIKIKVTGENKTKTLSKSFLVAGMSNPPLEASALRTLQSRDPDEDYHKVIIGSRNYEVIRNELTGIVLYRQVGVIAFGRDEKGCFFRSFRVVQVFNGTNYEYACQVDRKLYELNNEINYRGFSYIPCESVPK